jgi:hypothetical protein
MEKLFTELGRLEDSVRVRKKEVGLITSSNLKTEKFKDRSKE